MCSVANDRPLLEPLLFSSSLSECSCCNKLQSLAVQCLLCDKVFGEDEKSDHIINDHLLTAHNLFIGELQEIADLSKYTVFALLSVFLLKVLYGTSVLALCCWYIYFCQHSEFYFGPLCIPRLITAHQVLLEVDVNHQRITSTISCRFSGALVSMTISKDECVLLPALC